MPKLGDTWWVKPTQLDKDQREAHSLCKEKSHLLLGPPGSGKTNILLLQAEYLTRTKQPNIQLIVFNRTLQEFIRHGLDGTKKFPPKNVVTMARFLQKILIENDRSTDDLPSEPDASRIELARRVTSLLDEGQNDKIYQVLLLDEVQDYSIEELAIFSRLAERILAAGDFRQQIYSVKSKLESTAKYFDSVKELPFHYRNGLAICTLADNLMKVRPKHVLMVPSSKYDEADRPSTVEHCSIHLSLEDQCERVIEMLATQLRAYPGELLGIVCPRNADLDKVWSLLSLSSLGEKIVFQRRGSYKPFDDEHPVCLCSLSGAKGLEFRALHIIGTEKLQSEPKPREKAFMAVTRAKTSLSIFSASALIPFFEQALAELTPSALEPTLADLFGDTE